MVCLNYQTATIPLTSHGSAKQLNQPTNPIQNNMEILCKVLQQGQVKTREYVDKVTNQPAQFKTLPVLLQCGNGTMWAELVQEQATYYEQYPIDTGRLWQADVAMTGRTYVDANGQERQQTDIRLNRLVAIY